MKSWDEYKKYEQLPIPKDTAWERFTIRRYLPIWLKEIIEGIVNIIKWIPIIYKDKNWDNHFIYEILKCKLLFQRNHLVSDNRHEGVSRINKYITISLNLIESLQDGRYSVEYQGYEKTEYKMVPYKEGLTQLEINTISENHDEYINKNKLTHKKVVQYLKDNQEMYSSSYTDKGLQCLKISQFKEDKARKLLFKILEQEIEAWWD